MNYMRTQKEQQEVVTNSRRAWCKYNESPNEGDWYTQRTLIFSRKVIFNRWKNKINARWSNYFYNNTITHDKAVSVASNTLTNFSFCLMIRLCSQTVHSWLCSYTGDFSTFNVFMNLLSRSSRQIQNINIFIHKKSSK